jgi:predicted  nucleic acid-binding Zn-ribbon protein
VAGADTSLTTLKALLDSMGAVRGQIEAQTHKSRTGETDAIKENAKAEAEKLHGVLMKLQQDFESVATGLESGELDAKGQTEFDLKKQLDELVEPLLQQINAATEQPRAIERLRGELAALERRKEMINSAVVSVESLITSLGKPKDGTPDATLKKSLQQTQTKWKNHSVEVDGRVKVTEYRLQEQIKSRKSLWTLARDTLSTFIFVRGRNLLLGVLAFVIAFVGWRSLHRWFTRFSPWHRKSPRPFAARLVDVIYHASAVVVGFIVLLLVLYSASDWLLLGLVIIALIALALAAKNGVPKFYHQARVLLNLGEAREGERVVINGLPWEIKSLNLTSQLVNPALSGTLRLPVNQIMHLTSRPAGDSEPWYPCKEGDWVQLSNGVTGKVVCASPDFVQLVALGGARHTFNTVKFLDERPVNLSAGFRISVILPLGHAHRSEITTTIPQALARALESGLPKVIAREHLKSVRVFFRGVAANSLDLDIIADYDGAAAEKYGTLQRTMQRIAMETCNENGWQMPAAAK